MFLDCPRCRLTVYSAAFLSPPRTCSGCFSALEPRLSLRSAPEFEQALIRAVEERARPASRPDWSA